LNNEIHYIKREQLDVSKYDMCIRDAMNSRIYAYSWYLDCVADDWDVLVLGDYLAVMPLPKRKKYFIQYIYQPAWVQQLGVFSKENIDETFVRSFVKAIPNKFRKATIYFNDQNRFTSKSVSQRANYVLNLQADYFTLLSNYSKNRKHTIRKIDKNSIQLIESENHHNILPFYYDYIFDKSGLNERDMQNLNKLLSHAYQIDKAFVVEAVTEKNNKLGGAIFLIDNDRIYYLFSALSTDGKKEQAMTAIIDYIINKYSQKPILLDFEGSMIKGIASFFKSFGAKNIPYRVYQKTFGL